MNLESEFTAFDLCQWDFIGFLGKAHTTGGDNAADARGEKNANDDPDENTLLFYARHLTPSPKDL